MADDARTATLPWDLARHIAANPTTESWPQALAGAIEVAVRPDAVGVFLCRLGNVLQATSAMAPGEHGALGERLVGEFLPRMHRAGIETPWQLFADGHDEDGLKERLDLQVELLAPAGFTRMLGVFLRSHDGMLAGWIAIFSRSLTTTRREELQQALVPVARAAEATIKRAIGIASAVGARFPKISPDPLSDREQEIARMAASGFSDLNIARELAISEGTVGRHLHNIYRKLGVGSRIELVDLLCPPN
jgi:DNA-binding CsgD family transcriptional regulator